MLDTTDRAVQLLKLSRGLPPSDDLRGQLVLLRTHVRRRDMRAAEALIDTLIVEAEHEARLQRIVRTPTRRTNGRTNGRRPDCRFGWKYGKKGATRNRKHVCGPECSWTARECLDWNPPIKVRGKLTMQTRLVPVPPCANCDRTRADHWEPAADKVTGRLTGYRAIKECKYAPSERQAS